MKYYIVTFHVTDSNDTTVFDALIPAESQEQALAKLANSIEETLVTDKTNFSDDGSELGYYFDCAEGCPEDCEGHGGIALRDVTEYATEAEAEAGMAKYHTTWTV